MLISKMSISNKARCASSTTLHAQRKGKLQSASTKQPTEQLPLQDPPICLEGRKKSLKIPELINQDAHRESTGSQLRSRVSSKASEGPTTESAAQG
jgi:hypothetical protein